MSSETDASLVLSRSSSRMLPCDLSGPGGLNFHSTLMITSVKGLQVQTNPVWPLPSCHLVQIRNTAMFHVGLFSFGLMDYQIVFWMALSQKACWKSLSLQIETSYHSIMILANSLSGECFHSQGSPNKWPNLWPWWVGTVQSDSVIIALYN